MRGHAWWIIGLVVCGFASRTPAQTPEAPLLPFDGIYAFGWIGNEEQTNLNMGSSDFLIEFRLKPARITRANLPDTGIVAKKPFGSQPGYLVGITMTHDLVIYLNSKGRLQAGKDQYRLGVGGYFKPETWSHTAVLVQPSASRVVVFGDGKLVKTFEGIMLDDTDNWADFTVGIGNLMNHIRFHGLIDFVGVWRFAKGAPPDLGQRVAVLNAGEDRTDLAAVDGVRYSFWKLATSTNSAADRGSNGNRLYFMPENEARRLDAEQRPFTASAPRTLYADVNHPAADDGDGTADRPFKSLRRAVLAAQAGDTVVVRKGIYRELAEISGGRRGAPLRVIGEEGAVVSGFEALEGWRRGSAEGVWSLKGWTGRYLGPNDPSQIDGRRIPESIVFLDGAPLDWVEYVEDVIPGAYTIWPREKHKPVDFHIGLLPDDVPTNHTIEVVLPDRGIRVAGFVELKGMRLAGCSIGLDGEGCLAEGNTVEWGCIGVYGGNHRIVNNRVLWAPNAGLAGGGHSGCLFESNHIAYANWRLIDPNHGGGGAKLIPCCIDNIVRRNTFVYNYGAGFWYDAFNSGNVIEYNLCYDNSGHGGVFDEIGFGNTIRYNVIFNNWCRRQNRSGGNGLLQAESPEDVVYRNIVFNSERGNGILIRGFADRDAGGNTNAILEQSVKYPHHHVAAARQKAWLDKYCLYYKGKTVPQTGMKFIENISFNNHVSQLGTARDYRVKDHPKAAVYDFESDGNIFYCTDTNRIVASGDNTCSLPAWQAISGKDQHSRIIDPYTQTDALPKWATDLFDFKAYRFRPASEIADLKPDMRDSIQIMILKARLARASVCRKLEVPDPSLRAWLMNPEGTWMLTLWRSAGAGMVRVETGAKPVTFEDQWIRRKELSPSERKVTVFVGPDPVYLIGVSEAVALDRTFKGRRYGGAEEKAIPPVGRAPVLDGDLTDWATVQKQGPLAELNRSRCVSSDSARSWGGTNDVCASLWAAWCPTGLYVAVKAADDGFVAGQDAVDLFLDGREEWKHFFVEYQPGVLHIRLEPQSNGTVKVSTPPYSKGNYYASRKPEAVGVQARAVVTSGGYVIEGFLPWGKPNAETDSLKADTIVRMGLLVRDSDPEKTGAVTLKWHAGPSSDYDTTGWISVGMSKGE